MGLDGPMTHRRGIYHTGAEFGKSRTTSRKKLSMDNVTGILKRVDTMKLNDRDDVKFTVNGKETQGDRLNQIKAQRSKARAPVAVGMYV